MSKNKADLEKFNKETKVRIGLQGRLRREGGGGGGGGG